jgi:hypothetical protein
MSHRLLRFCMLAGLALVCGCNYVVGLGYLIGGPPTIEPDFDRMTNKSLTDKGVTVAVVCFAPTELKWDNAEIDQELAEFVTWRLHEHKVKVRRPEQVRAWIDQNPDYDKPEEVGEGVEVTHVVYIDLSKFSLYEPDASHLYRGRAEAVVSVVAKREESDDWEEVYVKEHISAYPLAIARPTSQESFGTFKRKYLDRLSDEIGRFFYEYHNGDDLPDAT